MKQTYIFKEIADITISEFRELHAVQISAWDDLSHSEKFQAMVHLNLDERGTFDLELHAKNNIDCADPGTIMVMLKCVSSTNMSSPIMVKAFPYSMYSIHFDGHDEGALISRLNDLKLDDEEHNFITEKIKKYMKLNVFA